MPPPKFPQPAARAFAVPDTSLVNMVDVQYWQVTNALPPIPVINLRAESPKEVDANLQGLRYEAKKRRVPMKETVDKYLDSQDYLTDETRDLVLDTWRRRAKKIGGIPKF